MGIVSIMESRYAALVESMTTHAKIQPEHQASIAVKMSLIAAEPAKFQAVDVDMKRRKEAKRHTLKNGNSNVRQSLAFYPNRRVIDPDVIQMSIGALFS